MLSSKSSNDINFSNTSFSDETTIRESGKIIKTEYLYGEQC